jgi:hypothetical protein
MSEAGEPAPLGQSPADEIARLAELYDRFAHALDPFDAGRDIAEQTFNSELAGMFDCLKAPKPPFRDFRRHVIALCKKHLKASDKPSSP